MKPKYTADAMRAKIQGDVEIQVVVNVKGEVERARVIQSLDKVFGLDDAALAAARQFRFEAGTLNGKPVPVAVTPASRLSACTDQRPFLARAITR